MISDSCERPFCCGCPSVLCMSQAWLGIRAQLQLSHVDTNSAKSTLRPQKQTKQKGTQRPCCKHVNGRSLLHVLWLLLYLLLGNAEGPEPTPAITPLALPRLVVLARAAPIPSALVASFVQATKKDEEEDEDEDEEGDSEGAKSESAKSADEHGGADDDEESKAEKSETDNDDASDSKSSQNKEGSEASDKGAAEDDDAEGGSAKASEKEAAEDEDEGVESDQGKKAESDSKTDSDKKETADGGKGEGGSSDDNAPVRFLTRKGTGHPIGGVSSWLTTGFRQHQHKGDGEDELTGGNGGTQKEKEMLEKEMKGDKKGSAEESKPSQGSDKSQAKPPPPDGLDELPVDLLKRLQDGASTRTPEEQQRLLLAAISAHRAAAKLKAQGKEPSSANLVAMGVSIETQNLIARALGIPVVTEASSKTPAANNTAALLPLQLPGGQIVQQAVGPGAAAGAAAGGDAADPLYQRLVANTPLMSQEERDKVWKEIKSVRTVVKMLVGRGEEPSSRNLEKAGVSIAEQRRLAWFLGIKLQEDEDKHKKGKGHLKVTIILTTLAVVAVVIGVCLWFRRKVQRSMMRMRHLYREAHLRSLQREARKVEKARRKKHKKHLKVLRLDTGASLEANLRHSESESARLIEHEQPRELGSDYDPRNFRAVDGEPLPARQVREHVAFATPPVIPAEGLVSVDACPVAVPYEGFFDDPNYEQRGEARQPLLGELPANSPRRH